MKTFKHLFGFTAIMGACAAIGLALLACLPPLKAFYETLHAHLHELLRLSADPYAFI